MSEINLNAGMVAHSVHQALLDRIAALEAEKATGWAVKVKPLEWHRTEGRLDQTEFASGVNRPLYWTEGSGMDEADKAAAEADHIARVTALLEPADQSAIDAAVKTERERCARVSVKTADDMAGSLGKWIAADIAAAIRAGGEG